MIENNKQQASVLKSRYLNFVSINDLREKELDGASLNEKELIALHNFDKYRIAELSKIKNEQAYHKRFSQLRIMAQLVPFEDFFGDKYL